MCRMGTTWPAAGNQTETSVTEFCYTQKLRNSSVVYHKTKNPFGTKISKDSSFQWLLYIIEVIYREDQ